MTAPTSIATSDPPPTVTWRDAITPLSRTSRRRWVVAYVLLLAALAASVVGEAFAIHRDDMEAIPLILVVALPVVFGMLRRGTRRITALDHPDLDERDVAARNAAYRIAFPLLVVIVITGFMLLGLSAPDETRRIATGNNGGFREAPGVFAQLLALVGLTLWIALWAVFLPTGVLAWREPDALEFEPSASGALAEPLRDALLGVALAGGLAASLLAESDVGLPIVVAALALLGAIGRRASGQPVMSRQRMVRVAIGIVLIALVVAYALVAGSEGATASR